MPATIAPNVRYNNVLMLEKSLPHGMFVNRNAQRFVNEGESYNDLVIDMYEQDAKDHATVPGWFIVDATYRSRYNLGPVLPGFVMSDKKLPSGWRPGEGWLYKADTLDDLARQINLDPEALRQTVDRFNGFARSGVDEDFHRGPAPMTATTRTLAATPNPTLGPIETPPFYAVPLSPSDLGTKSGLVTDNDGPGARRARPADPRPLRRRQLDVDRDGNALRGRRRHDRAGHGVRASSAARRSPRTLPEPSQPNTGDSNRLQRDDHASHAFGIPCGCGVTVDRGEPLRVFVVGIGTNLDLATNFESSRGGLRVEDEQCRLGIGEQVPVFLTIRSHGHLQFVVIEKEPQRGRLGQAVRADRREHADEGLGEQVDVRIRDTGCHRFRNSGSR